MKKYIILGTGQVGSAIMHKLIENNSDNEIILVNRSGKVTFPLPSRVTVTAADVTDKRQMTRLAKESEMIFCCLDAPYQKWASFYPSVGSSLITMLKNSDARVVYADNLYSYGNLQGSEMNENLPHSAKTKKGKIRSAVIHTLLESDPELKKRVAIVKAADFIGPNIQKGLFGEDFLIRLYNNKRIVLFGDISLPHTFTNIRDFATAMINISEAPDAFGQIWHAPNAPAISLDKWIHLFEILSNKGAKVTVLPKIAVQVTGLFNSFIKELNELAYQFEYPYLVNHDKYVSRFGNHSTLPSEIVRDTLSWYDNKFKK
jgi:nucleoside-diphosphate-sugar epimerase